MRRVLVTAATAALLGCGGGSKDKGPVDGGPPAALPTLTGSSAFTISDAGAIGAPPISCTIQGVPASATGLLVGFTSFGGVCDFVRAHKLCDEKASASQVVVVIVKAGLLTQTPVGPGTYTFVANPTPDGSGNLVLLLGEIVHSDATCTPTAPVEVTSGSVTITSATGSRVVGSANLTFADGSTVTGAFDVGTCAYAMDLCGFINGTNCPGTSACVP